MTITIEYHETETFALAAKALRAYRLFRDAAQATRDALPETERAMLDAHLAAVPETPFAAPTLAQADTLRAALQDAVDAAGGAPVLFEGQDGARHIVRGSEDGGRIQTAAERLADFLALAWQVHDQLTAEATIARQRKTLAEAALGQSAAPDRDAPA
jgi:hypothetical protein